MINLRSFFKNEIIEFLCHESDLDVIPPPRPAFKFIPDWFKKLPNDISTQVDQFGANAMTAKKCKPLLDAMSIGFIIPLWGDINVRSNADGSLIEAGRDGSGNNPYGPVVQFHDNFQLGGPTNTLTGKSPAIKFINRWVIKTSPGYSSLFIPPINNPDPRFTCLGGLVDTDIYVKEVNFPAIWHVKGSNEHLSAGTPLVTVIPVKRSIYSSDAPVRAMSKKELKNLDRIKRCQDSRSHVYSNELRCPR